MIINQQVLQKNRYFIFFLWNIFLKNVIINKILLKRLIHFKGGSLYG